MAAIYKAKFQGDAAAIYAVATHLPSVSVEADDGGFWLCGDPLRLGPDQKDLRIQLDAFSRKANALIALTDPNLAAIHPSGAIQVLDGRRRGHILLTEPGYFEINGLPVTLSARGGGRQPRPLAERLPELSAREPRFERAANLLAEAGEDLVKLYMVMELIERAHGNFPPKKKRADRQAFCNRIEVDEAQWEALHRTARAYRHAEPHEDDGPLVMPRQARYLIQHALKLWLERDVPV